MKLLRRQNQGEQKYRTSYKGPISCVISERNNAHLPILMKGRALSVGSRSPFQNYIVYFMKVAMMAPGRES